VSDTADAVFLSSSTRQPQLSSINNLLQKSVLGVKVHNIRLMCRPDCGEPCTEDRDGDDDQRGFLDVYHRQQAGAGDHSYDGDDIGNQSPVRKRVR